jgi:GT2 family glycosyltransferase
VAFLDSDDWWCPRKLEVSVRNLDAGADFVYHDMYLVRRQGQSIFLRRAATRRLKSPVFDDLMGDGNAINNSSVVVRRAVVQAIGGFSEDRTLIAAEDYDAWLRIAKVTEAFVRIPRVMGYYWAGGENLTSPTRTVKLLEAIERRYSDELLKLGSRRSVHWIDYLKARSHYVLGSYDAAAHHLTSIRMQRAPLSVRAKAMWMSLLIYLRRAGGRRLRRER